MFACKLQGTSSNTVVRSREIICHFLGNRAWLCKKRGNTFFSVLISDLVGIMRHSIIHRGSVLIFVKVTTCLSAFFDELPKAIVFRTVENNA